MLPLQVSDPFFLKACCWVLVINISLLRASAWLATRPKAGVGLDATELGMWLTCSGVPQAQAGQEQTAEPLLTERSLSVKGVSSYPLLYCPTYSLE